MLWRKLLTRQWAEDWWVNWSAKGRVQKPQARKLSVGGGYQKRRFLPKNTVFGPIFNGKPNGKKLTEFWEEWEFSFTYEFVVIEKGQPPPPPPRKVSVPGFFEPFPKQYMHMHMVHIIPSQQTASMQVASRSWRAQPGSRWTRWVTKAHGEVGSEEIMIIMNQWSCSQPGWKDSAWNGSEGGDIYPGHFLYILWIFSLDVCLWKMPIFL